MNLRTHQYTKPLIQILLAFLLSGCTATKKGQPGTSILIIRNINVVDVLNGTILPGQDVVVKDQLIYFIGNSFPETIPSNTNYIDGTNKFLSPGLWDMHFHGCWQNNNDSLLFPILLKNGITGIRDMGGDLGIMRRFKTRLQKGEITGPVIVGAGPMIDGNPPVYSDFSLPVDDNTNIKARLDSLKNKGADFFKTYSLLREKQLDSIAAYSRSNHINFAGHLSEYIEPEISITLGQKSVEHLNRLDDIWKTNKSRLDSIGNLMKQNGTFLCPTLLTYQLKTRVRDTSIVMKSYDQYISPSMMDEWKKGWTKRMERHTKNGDWSDLEKTFTSQLALVNHLNQMGIMILAGSDFAGMPYVYPGISLHQELSLLVKAGLTNQQALQTATINPAIYLSLQHWYGSVSTGKYADLLILEKNPLADINNLTTIENIIQKGKALKWPE